MNFKLFDPYIYGVIWNSEVGRRKTCIVLKNKVYDVIV